jgi:hypothetical protein
MVDRTRPHRADSGTVAQNASGSLPISVFSVEDAFDLKIIAMVAKEDAVVLGAQADQRRNDALQLLGGAFTGEDIAAQSIENLNGDGLLNRADVGLAWPVQTMRLAITVRVLSFPNRPW